MPFLLFFVLKFLLANLTIFLVDLRADFVGQKSEGAKSVAVLLPMSPENENM